MSATTGNDLLTGTTGNDVIDLLAGDDTYAGFAGSDSILGGDGNDSISGDDGSDTVLGGNGADSISGGNDNDMIFPGSGSDSVDAGAGSSDSIRYNNVGALSEAITATITAPTGSSGYNYAIVTSATQGNDTIAGFERLEATSNSGDLLQVNSAATASNLLFLYGAGGNDTISVTGANNAVMADYNTGSSVSGFTRGVSVDLATGADTAGNPTGVATDAFGTDVLINVRGVAGSSLADTMFGTGFDDRFRSYAGNDYIDGRGGSDLVDYAANASSQAISVNLAAGTANDGMAMTVAGATVYGTDTLISIEQVRGGSGNDTLIGGNGNELLRGNGGNDFIDGGNGSDIADYSNNASSQAVSVNLSAERASDGLGGTDTLISIENVWGGSGNDTILSGNGDDSISGGNGNDWIFPGSGSDSVDAGAGSTDNVRYNGIAPLSEAVTAIISAPAGISAYNYATVTSATQGNDTIVGFERLESTNFNDTIVVRSAATSPNFLFVYGSSGNDTIAVADGNNKVWADYNTSGSFTRGVSVDLFTGNDTVVIGADTITGPSGTATDAFGTDRLFNVRSVVGTSLADTILGTGFGDRFRGLAGGDSIDGRAGTDIVDYSSNSSSQAIIGTLSTGFVSDGIVGASSIIGTDTLANIEQVWGGSGNDCLIGGDGNDLFRGNGGSDTFNGGNGTEDILDLSSATGVVSVSLASGRANDGLGGNDSFAGIEGIYAGTLADTLIGSNGNEIFDGGMGGDLIDGGLGYDRVRYYNVSGNNSSVTRGVSVDLAAQRATDGWGGQDTLIGIERVTATTFNDTLLGDNVSNRFNGLAGNDSIDGGLSSDWLEYSDSAATTGVTVNLTTGTASDGRGGTDSFTSIENVSGGSFADHLAGIAQLGRATSRLRGGGGSDTLVGIEGEFVSADYTDQTVGLSVNLASGSVNDGLGGIDSLVNIRGAIMYGNFADTIIGTAGNDWLSPSGGNDTIVGGNGFDILGYDGNPTSGVSVNLAAGTASDGDGGTDIFAGIEGVAAGYSNDTVIGDGGDNIIALGAGADYADAAGGRDTISATLGSSPNTQIYTFNEAGNGLPFTGVTIDLAAGRATDQSGATDTILNFEAAIGSTMHDSILGSNGNDVLDGAEGNDTISGGAGNDTFISGDGDDLLMGGSGDDLYLVAGTTGSPTIDGMSGNDTVSLNGVSNENILNTDLSNSSGIEAIDLARGGNMLHLTAARAVSVSGTGLFRVFGGSGDSLVFDDTGWVRTGSSGGFDTMSNSVGNATVISSSGLVSSDVGSVVNGGDGNDTLAGANGADTIDGGNGADIITGFGGSDSMLGGDGADSISGGDGADTALGGAGNDLILGGNGNDSLSGGDGADTLSGGGTNADDTMSGGLGDDLFLVAGQNNGLLIDAGGNDTVSLQGASADTTSALAGDLNGVVGFEAIDLAGTGHRLGLTAASVIALSDTDVLRVFGSGNDVLVFEDTGWNRGATSGGFVTFTNGGATVIAAESLVPAAAGPTAGDDTLSGTSGNDVIDLLAGNDAYSGLDGDDSILGNDGNDSISGGNGADNVQGGNGADSIGGNDGNDTVLGGNGDDSLSGGNDADSVLGDAGNDSLGGNTGNDIILGGDGADTIIGGNGDDSISGGNGDDRIFGEAGNDTIDAGAGTTDRVLYSHSGGPAITATVNNDGSTSGVNRATVTSADGTDSILGFEILSGSNAADQITVQTAATAAAGLFIFGNSGNDTIVDNYRQGVVFADYNSSIVTTSGISVNLATGIASDGAGGTDSLVGVTAINASSFGDTLLGSNGNDRFRPLGGSDSINGGDGSADIVDYSSNSATQAVSLSLLAGRADDGWGTLGGVDTLVNIEWAYGGAGNDTLIGDTLDNVIRGNAGSDSLDGGTGTGDVADYSFNSLGVSVNLGTGRGGDTSTGTDTLLGFERIWGSASGDTLIGSVNDDVLRGNGGSDSIDGGLGSGDVADYRNATTGISVNLATGTAQDGQSGIDTLIGIERVWGSTFNDTMVGGNGDDFFVGSSGADTFVGGGGIDTVDYSFNPANNTAATRGVSIDLAAGTGRDGYDSAEILQSIEVIIGTSFADTISGGTANESLYGNGGPGDSLGGGGGNDWLFGSTGTDTLVGGNGVDSLSGAEGNDLYFVSDALDQIIETSGGGADTVITSVSLSIPVQVEALQIAAGVTGITLTGGAGNDMLVGNGLANNFSGGAGDDVILAGNVTLADIYALFGP